MASFSKVGGVKFYNVKALFVYLNEFYDYLILRNFEQIDTEQFLIDSHDDIDILCQDPKNVRKAIHAKKESVLGHYDHYWIIINEHKVEIGIRYVGDNYYDINWERNMLNTKIKYKNFFNIMGQENYFYSLIYHCLFHKKTVSEDYINRINNMHIQNETISKESLLPILSKYMISNGYSVTYPVDITIPNIRMYKEDISPLKIEGFSTWKMRRLFFLPKRIIRKLNHR